MAEGPDRRVTVVIATRNRRDELDATLRRLAALPERPPVIVVDNASDDGTVETVRARHRDVRVITSDRNLGAAGRNLGVEAAETPYAALTDDDSWWAPGALSIAADALDAHPGVGLVAARILVGPEERLDPTSEAMAGSPLESPEGLPGRSVLGFLACGAVVRRAAYLEAGGFEPRLQLGAEEQLLAMDLRQRGWRLQYLPEVVAHHHPSGARDAEGRRRLIARNDVWAAWLRRPLPVAFGATAEAARRAMADPHARAGLADALRGAGWVLREREVVGPRLEAELRALER